MKTRIQQWRGLRLLRQPLGEALFGFLCSSAKRIPQIKACCEAVAETFGEPLAGGLPALPTWAALARVPEAALRACGLGYRAGYVCRTAQFLAAHPGWLEGVQAAPYADAHKRLRLLPGVGEKVADCVLLYGAHKLEAFPVDTWILQAMQRLYGLEGWTLGHVAHFGRVHFGPYAGLAQQYLFASERNRKRLGLDAAPPTV